MKKSHVQLAWNPFFGWFRVPLLGLNIHIQGMHTQLTLLKWPALYIARLNRTLNGKLYEVGSLEKVPLALAMNSIMVVLLEICLVFQINPISYLYFFWQKPWNPPRTGLKVHSALKLRKILTQSTSLRRNRSMHYHRRNTMFSLVNYLFSNMHRFIFNFWGADASKSIFQKKSQAINRDVTHTYVEG